MSIQTISVQEFQQCNEGGERFDVIDVRSPGEYTRVHATPSRNLPLSDLKPAELVAIRNEGSPRIALLCQMGGRAMNAAKQVAEHSDEIIYVLEGGTNAWLKADLPVIRGKGVIPEDRQVHITVGLLIVTGVVLGHLVSPWWYVLSGAIGLGLLNAGLTGICPLGMLMAAMPWNKSGATCQVASSAPIDSHAREPHV